MTTVLLVFIVIHFILSILSFELIYCSTISDSSSQASEKSEDRFYEGKEFDLDMKDEEDEELDVLDDEDYIDDEDD